MAGVNPSNLLPLTTLGRGSYGKVILAKNDDPEYPEHRLVAVKVVSKIRIKTKGQLLKNETELRVMREIAPSCRFLVGTLGGYQTDHCLFYLMPYSAGGELFFHLQRQGHFLERETRQIAMQVVLALEHLHANGIVYRDLKPENVLINDRGICQLADFGLSKFLPANGNNPNVLNDQSAASLGDSGALVLVKTPSTQQMPRKSSQNMLLKPALGMATRMRNIFRRSMASATTTARASSSATAKASNTNTGASALPPAGLGDWDPTHLWGRTKTRCGSPAYQSPEVVEAREHGLEADWWSLGIFIYELFVGHPPFFADTVKEVYELILRNEPRWSRKLTDNARDIVQRLLKSDCKQRLGYGEEEGRKQLKNHAFFLNTDPSNVDGDAYATWDQVSRLETKPCVFLSETGVVGAPEDAVFFHSEYTSMDVREYVPPCPKKIEVEGFKHLPVDSFALFVSPDPIPVGEKGGGGGDELKKL